MEDSVSSNVTPISSQDQGEASRQELLKRLDEASKRAEETRAKREELETQGELERRVLEAEREAADQEALLNAESEHGSSRIATVIIHSNISVTTGATYYICIILFDPSRNISITFMVRRSSFSKLELWIVSWLFGYF